MDSKVLIILSLITLFSCQNNKKMNNNLKVYDWDVQGGAPKNYPSVFYYADFIYDGGSKSVPAGDRKSVV